MSKIRQYIPSFVDTEPIYEEFNSLEELKDISFVNRYLNLSNFYQLSQIQYDGEEVIHLIAEYDKGSSWKVIGFVTTEKPLELPKWTQKF